jgi:opacity protein-like surface antigen
MMAIRKLITGAILATAAAAMSLPASAQDYGNWSGLYIGASAGWIGSDVGWTYHDPAGGVVDRPLHSASTDAALAGVHLGLQHQFNQFVIGVEGGLSGTGFSDDWGTRACFNPAVNCNSRLDGLLFTAGGRLGWAPSNRWLLFVSGGVASVAVETREVVASTGLANQFGTRDRHLGWYIGGGVEYAITSNWNVGVEYLHFDFEDVNHLSSVNFEHRRIGVEADAVRARLSFKLGRPEEKYEPMK